MLSFGKVHVIRPLGFPTFGSENMCDSEVDRGGGGARWVVYDWVRKGSLEYTNIQVFEQVLEKSLPYMHVRISHFWLGK